MKRITLLVVILLAVPSLKAQKKEIKAAQREISARNFRSAASHLSQARRIFAAADRKTRAEYYVVEAELRLAEKPLDIEQIKLISQSLKLAKSYEVTSSLLERISRINSKIKGSSTAIAAGEFAKKNYSNAATLYKSAYQSAQDTVHLLKAARSHLLAKEYNDAFESYRHLYNIGFTSGKTQYVATNVRSKKKEAFSSKSSRDKAIADGSYRKPEIVTTNNKLPEILRGLTVASISLDKNYEAVAIINAVVDKTPGDKVLLNQVSHFYRQLGAYDKYYAIMDQLIKETPNDPNLYYNSALTSAQNDDPDRAKIFYKKALKVDPKYIKAKVNLAMLLLEGDKTINEEMNDLGDTEADNERYEKLKKERINLYYDVLPYLESIVESQPGNEDMVKKLKNIYSFIGRSTRLVASEENIDD